MATESQKKYWNSLKGKKRKPFTIEHKNNISKGKMGHFVSEETKKKISKNKLGKPTWNKGKTNIYSKETLEKMSNSKKGTLPWNTGTKRTFEDRVKISLGHTKEKEFIGFKSSENKIIRYSPEYLQWKISIFKRDDYVCQRENCPYCNNIKNVTIHAHHIKHFSKCPELRLNIDNGMTYCKDYHLKSDLHNRCRV